jgi:hypothetical protein
MSIRRMMQQLINETTIAATKLFGKLPIRIWYVMITETAWRCFVINTDNKIKLAKGPVRQTSEGCVMAVKKQLETIVGKKKTV